jgi:hypothetical protein
MGKVSELLNRSRGKEKELITYDAVMTSVCTYFNKKLTNNMASVLTYNVRTLYVHVRANGSCYTVLEPGRATNYLQADVDTTATLRGFIRIFI